MQCSQTVPSFKLIALTLSAIRRDLFSGSFGFKASRMSTNVRESTHVPGLCVCRWVKERKGEGVDGRDEEAEGSLVYTRLHLITISFLIYLISKILGARGFSAK